MISSNLDKVARVSYKLAKKKIIDQNNCKTKIVKNKSVELPELNITLKLNSLKLNKYARKLDTVSENINIINKSFSGDFIFNFSIFL
tara:strand:- start:56 stop:316 length:261 start_codon:yes stop_codon:yes gene_type:complete